MSFHFKNVLPGTHREFQITEHDAPQAHAYMVSVTCSWEFGHVRRLGLRIQATKKDSPTESIMNVQKEVLVRLQASQVLLALPVLLFACW